MAGETARRLVRRAGPLAALIALLVLVPSASASYAAPRDHGDWIDARSPGGRVDAAAAAQDSERRLGPDLVAVALAEEAPAPLTLDDVLAAAAAAWPEQPRKAAAVTYCELGGWLNPKAFDLSQRFGGPMQIDRPTWEPYFLARYGWTWDQVALDLSIHFAAAREIYELAGGWSPWPVCGR